MRERNSGASNVPARNYRKNRLDAECAGIKNMPACYRVDACYPELFTEYRALEKRR